MRPNGRVHRNNHCERINNVLFRDFSRAMQAGTILSRGQSQTHEKDKNILLVKNLTFCN